jgi:hypothetical protein
MLCEYRLVYRVLSISSTCCCLWVRLFQTRNILPGDVLVQEDVLSRKICATFPDKCLRSWKATVALIMSHKQIVSGDLHLVVLVMWESGKHDPRETSYMARDSVYSGIDKTTLSVIFTVRMVCYVIQMGHDLEEGRDLVSRSRRGAKSVRALLERPRSMTPLLKHIHDA